MAIYRTKALANVLGQGQTASLDRTLITEYRTLQTPRVKGVR